VLAIAGLAGCAQGGTIPGQATASAATDTVAAAQQAQAAPTTLNATDNPQLGQILTDGDGRTLYRFDKDTAKPSKSNCEGDCATAWPPLLKGTEDTHLGRHRTTARSSAAHLRCSRRRGACPGAA
jgi:predicted lipoprotein with Yx(FWY)xxD motif